MMKRKMNSELFLESLICFILGIVLFYAIISGKASLYVHPRLNGLLWAAAGVLIVIAFFMLRHAFTPKHNAKPMKYMLYLLPLLAVIFIPAGVVQGKTVSFGSNTAGGIPSSSSVSSQDKGTVISNSTSLQDDGSSSTPSDSSLPQESKNGITTITDENFAKWYQDINQNMKKYVGKTLKFKGQVFRMKGFAKNEIVPARYAMVCCTADLQPCGILCRGNIVTKYKDNDWVWVTGNIKIENYQGEAMPVCYVTKIEQAEKAKQDYIYFTY